MQGSILTRSILITGCSSGIGKYCAQQLGSAGWRVFATARTDKDLKMLDNLGIEGLCLDYGKPDTIHACFQGVMEQTGGTLDALFNNGAYGQPGAVEDLSTDVLRDQFEANFFGWHTLTNLALPVMRRQGHGRIIHCSSVLGLVPYPWRGAYNATKFAIEGLASTMRLELAGTNIHVSLIEPGPIKTNFSETCLTHFKVNIDIENSVHQKSYQGQLEQLADGGGRNPFRKGPGAVYKKLDHALNSKRPRAHYPVAVPTHVMGMARRILPQSILDKILISSG